MEGDSMIEAQLFDGDLAIVDRSLQPASGDVVVVDVYGQRSFKVWSCRGPRVILSFANRRYPELTPRRARTAIRPQAPRVRPRASSMSDKPAPTLLDLMAEEIAFAMTRDGANV